MSDLQPGPEQFSLIAQHLGYEKQLQLIDLAKADIYVNRINRNFKVMSTYLCNGNNVIYNKQRVDQYVKQVFKAQQENIAWEDPFQGISFLNQEHPYHYKLDLTKFTDVNEDLASNRYDKLPWVNEREEVLKNRALFGKLDTYKLKSYTNSMVAVEFDFALKYDLWTRINISNVEIFYELTSTGDQAY